jgi:hypothetical protein
MGSELYTNIGASNPSKVVIQTFDQYFVTTKNWDNLTAETPDLSEYFTAFLLPPLSASADAVGYIPTELFNFNSSWGSDVSLKNLINVSNNYNVDLIADVVTQHRVGGDKKPNATYNKTTDQHVEGSGRWFRYKNPTFLDQENIPEDQYYKYIDTVLYNPWGLDENVDAPKNAFINGLPPDYSTNGLQHCYVKNKEDGKWSLYKDCRNKVPMYDTAGKANPSWLQSVNLCNINVLKTYIKYLKLLKSMGIKGIRYDQADAVSYQFISLFLNSDINKTPYLLQEILKICNEAKNPKVDKNVIYTLENDFKNTNLEELTGVPFDYEVIENFYPFLYGTDVKDKGWRGLNEMLDNINSPLNEDDWTGEFDYSLKFILNEMFNTKDLSLNGTVFKKENMLLSNNKYKSLIFTFIDNQDTNYLVSLYYDVMGSTRGISKTELNFYRIIPAYFVILLLPGIPMVSKVYFDIYKRIGIQTFIQLRNELGIDSNSNFEITASETNNIAWKITNLFPNIKGRYSAPKIIKTPINANGTILAEINKVKPTDKNAFSQQIYNSELYMKITILTK